MTDEDERDLHERFAALRREEEAAAPSIAGLLARAGTRKGGEARPGRFVVLAGAAVVLLILVLRPGGEPKRPLAAPSITDWKSPTGFLLQTPGREILESLPRLGEGLIPPESNQRRTPS